jgi:hypothetical protein
MKNGICTNQPSLCKRAAARELMPMPAADTRCPEPGCGKPLLPAPGGAGRARSTPIVPIIAVAGLVLALIGAGIYLRKANDSSSIATTPAPAVTVKTPPGTAVANSPPQSKPDPNSFTVNPVTHEQPGPAEPAAPQAIPPAPKPKPRPTSAVSAKPPECRSANWTSASCSLVETCFNEPESPTLCAGLDAAACRHVSSCLGVAIE